MNDITLSAVIHGDSGTGKSWLCRNLPGPRLYLDVEGRIRFVPFSHRVPWDVRTPIPTDLNTDSTVIAKVKDWASMEVAFQWLASGQHPFRSVVIDSLSELQKRSMDALVGTSAMQTQDWGTLLRRMEHVVRSMRDMADPESVANPINVVFLAGSAEKQGKNRPMLQGAISMVLPYHVDLCGYLSVEPNLQDPMNPVRTLRLSDNGLAVAKDGTDVLTRHYGPVIANPDFGEMFAVLAHYLQPPAAA